MYDYSSKTTFEPIEAGNYEAVIDTAEFKETPTGKKYISVKFVIRKDVEQPHQGRVVWDNIWENDVYRNKEGRILTKKQYEELPNAEKASVTTTREYNYSKIRTLVNAQDNDKTITDANGVKQENPDFITKFDDHEQVVQFLNGMPLQIQVLKFVDDSTGDEKNSVEYKGIRRTKHHLTEQTIEQPTNTSGPEQSVDDDDLPF